MLKALPRAPARAVREPARPLPALRQIAEQMRASEELAGGSDPQPLDDLQLSDLDRLLWIYLRMLYTQPMLERFFERTSEDQIQAEIRGSKQRIAGLPPPMRRQASASRQTIRKALEDNLETCRGRLANLEKAREN